MIIKKPASSQPSLCYCNQQNGEINNASIAVSMHLGGWLNFHMHRKWWPFLNRWKSGLRDLSSSCRNLWHLILHISNRKYYSNLYLKNNWTKAYICRDGTCSIKIKSKESHFIPDSSCCSISALLQLDVTWNLLHKNDHDDSLMLKPD